MTDSVGKPLQEHAQRTWIGSGSTVASNKLSERTAEQQAAFFLPYLQPGMDLLDCGCGPGSITLGLARCVDPGRVVGIDLDASKIELAREYGSTHGQINLRFETADIHDLPFPDASFHAIFSNAVLTYAPDPLVPLREMYRVLKPGGLLGIRNVDYDGHLFTATSPPLTRWWELFTAIQVQRNYNPFLGKHQRRLLQQSGFKDLRISATYECYGTEETARSWGQGIAEFLQEENSLGPYVELGAERSEIEQMRRAWQEWGEDPEAFFADSYCEAVGWKPEGEF